MSGWLNGLGVESIKLRKSSSHDVAVEDFVTVLDGLCHDVVA